MAPNLLISQKPVYHRALITGVNHQYTKRKAFLAEVKPRLIATSQLQRIYKFYCHFTLVILLIFLIVSKGHEKITANKTPVVYF